MAETDLGQRRKHVGHGMENGKNVRRECAEGRRASIHQICLASFCEKERAKRKKKNIFEIYLKKSIEWIWARGRLHQGHRFRRSGSASKGSGRDWIAAGGTRSGMQKKRNHAMAETDLGERRARAKETHSGRE